MCGYLCYCYVWWRRFTIKEEGFDLRKDFIAIVFINNIHTVTCACSATTILTMLCYSQSVE